MPKKYIFGFVADPLDSFDREAETSLFLMREIEKRGHRLVVCEKKDIFLKQNEVCGVVKHIELTNHHHSFYRILKEEPFAFKTLDILFLRKDPPFDLQYLHHLYLLSKLEGEVLMINAPSSILRYNEKLTALNFPFAPKTWVGSNLKHFSEWARGFKKGVVVKPLHEGGGRGIHWFHKISGREEKLFRKMTHKETSQVIVQEYRPEIRGGDRRILIWDGEILGAFVRKPKKGEFRANLHMGGHFEACSLTAHQKRVSKIVGKWAKKQELYFVGCDLIGPFLTEINVTSPMGIREVNTLYNKKIEIEIIDSVLNKL